MTECLVPFAVTAFANRLTGLGYVSDVWVAGSLATGDFVEGVSDLDLVAIVSGQLCPARIEELAEVHSALDAGVAAGSDLGCVYVAECLLGARDVAHPTWTHGRLVRRTLSGITRVELVLHGFAAVGRPPSTLLSPVGPDDVRRAASEELCGYWAVASRRPWWWLSRTMVDLGLTSMARSRHARRHGELLAKTDAIADIAAPAWLREDVLARRNGDAVTSPRLRSAYFAWIDARRTVRSEMDRVNRG